MPWKIDENNCVIRADTGKQMHCYPKTPEGKADAEKYLKALYANAGGDIKKQHTVYSRCKECGTVLKGGQGNMEGLATHLAHKLGTDDPGWFTKCTEASELDSYDTEQKDAICAKAHDMVLGHWPGSDKGTKKEKKIKISFKYHPEWLGKQH